MGYIVIDEENLAFTGNYFNVLSHANFLIKDTIHPISLKFMSPEEAKKEDILWKNKKEMHEKKKQELARKKEMQHYSELDRKVKGEEKNPDSKGNQLKFGANMKKFEPPAAQRGG